MTPPRQHIRLIPPIERHERPMVDDPPDPPDPPMDWWGRVSWFGILLGYVLLTFLLYRLWVWME